MNLLFIFLIKKDYVLQKKGIYVCEEKKKVCARLLHTSRKIYNKAASKGTRCF